MRRTLQRALVAAWLLALHLVPSGCARNESETTTAQSPAATVSVKDVELGRSIGGDKRVTDKTDSFRPNDIIYATVVTDGSSSSSTIKVRWTYEDGQIVEESQQTITPTGEAATEFHISKPDGWPTGKYRVEVFVDGAPASQKDFQVTQG